MTRPQARRRADGAAPAQPPWALSVIEARQRLSSGEMTPEGYLEALFERQARWSALNAYTQQRMEEALAAARRVEVGASPIAGVPIAVKDNIDVAGYATTAGTPGLAEHRPKATAPMVQGLIDLGAVVSGKTGLHEFAAGGTCANIAFGPIRNPYDLSRMPGGSSGGAAAAVAAGLVPAAIGSDTAGSSRGPAALCGCVGFRPTTGRYSRVGLVPGDLRRDTIGWLARSCADIALLDRFSVAPAARAAGPAPEIALRGLRLGVPRRHFYEDLDPTVEPVVLAALARLEAAGAQLVEVDLPGIGERLGQLEPLGRDLAGDLDLYLAESGAATTPEAIFSAIADPQLRAMLRAVLAERDLHDRAYLEARDVVLPALRASYADCFAAHEIAALIAPTCPVAAPPIPADLAAGGAGPMAMIRNTLPATWAGAPGLSIPAGLTGRGLPVGIELDASPGADATLLAIGALVQAALGPLPPPSPPGPTAAG